MWKFPRTCCFMCRPYMLKFCCCYFITDTCKFEKLKELTLKYSHNVCLVNSFPNVNGILSVHVPERCWWDGCSDIFYLRSQGGWTRGQLVPSDTYGGNKTALGALWDKRRRRSRLRGMQKSVCTDLAGWHAFPLDARGRQQPKHHLSLWHQLKFCCTTWPNCIFFFTTPLVNIHRLFKNIACFLLYKTFFFPHKISIK